MLRLLAALLSASASLAAADAAAPTPGVLADELGTLGRSPAEAQAPSLLPTLLNVAFSLAFVVGLVYLAYWLLLKWRERQGPAQGAEREGLVRVLEKQYVDPKHGVAVVEVGDEVFILGLGDEVTALGRVSDPAAVEKLRQQAPVRGGLLGFREQFERVGQKLKQQEWSRAKRSLKDQSRELEATAERLRQPGRGQEE